MAARTASATCCEYNTESMQAASAFTISAQPSWELLSAHGVVCLVLLCDARLGTLACCQGSNIAPNSLWSRRHATENGTGSIAEDGGQAWGSR